MKRTRQDLLLEAALKLPQPFTAQQLIVRAWKDAPAAFGLYGYSDLYPDANKVLASLMGQDGLVGRGRLKRVKPGLYEVVTP